MSQHAIANHLVTSSLSIHPLRAIKNLKEACRIFSELQLPLEYTRAKARLAEMEMKQLDDVTK